MFYIYLFKLNLILKNYNIFLRCSPNFSDNKTIVYVGWPWPDVVKTELPERHHFFMNFLISGEVGIILIFFSFIISKTSRIKVSSNFSLSKICSSIDKINIFFDKKIT